MKALWRQPTYSRYIADDEVENAERFAQDPTLRPFSSKSAYQDSPKHRDEAGRKNALEQLRWRDLGVYS